MGQDGHGHTVGQGAQDLSGAVDLANPIQQAGRAFLTTLAKEGGKSAVFMGLDGNGRLVVTHYTPGGLTELCGIALLGAMTVLMQAWAVPQQQPSPLGEQQES